MTKPTGKPIGRPKGIKHSAPIPLQVTQAQRDALYAYAKRQDTTASEIIRQLISRELENDEQFKIREASNAERHRAEQKRLIQQHRTELERLIRDSKKLNENLGALLASEVFL